MSVYSDLVGQEHVVEILQKAVAATRSGQESQEMTHAWVFTGPPGSGRSSAAIAFAQALVCALKMVVAHAMNADLLLMDHTLMLK